MQDNKNMLFTWRIKPRSSDDIFNDNEPIEKVDPFKFLGVSINSELSLVGHIQFMTNKISKERFISCKAKRVLNLPTLLTSNYIVSYIDIYYINQSIKSSFVKGAGAHPKNTPCRRRSHALGSAPVRRGRLLSTVLRRWSPRHSILSAGLG